MDPVTAAAPANRLSHETSPYLRQHAHNPVDWYPWGAAALEKARAEHKPILLSVGYSACHWCHVMAHESFEDPAIAAVMNDLFVNIKVDREERPDIDRIYQVAQQMLTQRPGGWPLTMFLTHDDQRPFFGGTYFPREARFGLPSFRDLLLRVAEYYRDHESDLRAQNDALMSAFNDLNPPAGGADTQLTDTPLTASRALLAKTFDPRNGGFGGTPKFPHPKTLERLLRDWHLSAHSLEPDLHALYMATLTLRRMADGGMNDQLAGGFARYSVDEYWMIPHFEKMLYDNGALLAVYADAAAATGDAYYARIAAETAAWVIRDMQAPEGGYYSSYDADSEGHEGKFYVWTRDEVKQTLTSEEYAVFAPHFGLDRAPNFEGHWHLHVFQPTEEVDPLIESARHKLLAIRNHRVWPGRDDKILTSWNALMIRGMAIAARVLDRADLEASATRALGFVRNTLWREGRLLATYKDGRAHLNAYLDDYVYLADAILELQQVRFRSDELAFAQQLLDVVLKHFADPDGGFFFTSDDHEALIHRSKSFSDDATPAGNGIAAFVLQRMGHLLGEPRYLAAAERTLQAAWPVLEKYPQGHTTLLIALEETLNSPETVILRGDAATIETWRRDLAKLYAPRRVVLAVPADATDLPPALADKPAPATNPAQALANKPARATGLSPAPTDKPTGAAAALAYVCQGSVCSAPLDSFSALAAHLRQAASSQSP